MKHEALASAVTAIDDDLLQDAITVPPVPRRPAFGRWGAIAAALLLVFGISVLWQQSGTLRLSVGNTIIGSQPVPAITEAVPRTAAEPALYTLGSLEVPLTLSGRGNGSFPQPMANCGSPREMPFPPGAAPNRAAGPVPFFGPFRSPRRGKPTALPSMRRQ